MHNVPPAHLVVCSDRASRPVERERQTVRVDAPAQCPHIERERLVDGREVAARRIDCHARDDQEAMRVERQADLIAHRRWMRAERLHRRPAIARGVEERQVCSAIRA